MVTLLAAFLVALLSVQRDLAAAARLEQRGRRARTNARLAVLDWMRLHESEARAAGQRVNGSPESGSLLTVVANSAAHAGLQLLRYQKEGDGVSVVLQNQSFNSLIGWIAELEHDDHVTVKQISIDGQDRARLGKRQNNSNIINMLLILSCEISIIDICRVIDGRSLLREPRLSPPDHSINLSDRSSP